MEDGQVLVHILLLVSVLFQDYQYPWLSRDSKPVHNIPDEAERTSYIKIINISTNTVQLCLQTFYLYVQIRELYFKYPTPIATATLYKENYP